ncbi:8103_t:CDS:2 [Funneliformis geosporum]|nr:8103_t:CDS:2 [Funneliformis geosporum]
MIHISESFFLPPASKLPRPTSSSKDQTSSEVLRSGESSKTSRSETALRTGTAPRATNSTSKSTTPVLRPTTPFLCSPNLNDGNFVEYRRITDALSLLKDIYDHEKPEGGYSAREVLDK